MTGLAIDESVASVLLWRRRRVGHLLGASLLISGLAHQVGCRTACESTIRSVVGVGHDRPATGAARTGASIEP